MPFKAILGHALPVRILRGMLKTGRIPQALLFSGIDGIGKRTMAVSFAKALSCRSGGDDFCDACAVCRKIERGTHPDYLYIGPENNVIKIEKIRALQEQMAISPLEGTHKVAVIDQADRLNMYAANSLLKMLEEPPAKALLILIASNTAGMLPTIMSRCQRVVFAPLADDEIGRLLAERGFQRQETNRVMFYAQGSIQRAMALLESGFLEKRGELAVCLADMEPENFEAVFHMAQLMSGPDVDQGVVLEFLATWYHDVLMTIAEMTDTLLYNPDLSRQLAEAARHETWRSAMNKIKQVQWLRNNAHLHVDMQVSLVRLFTERG